MSEQAIGTIGRILKNNQFEMIEHEMKERALIMRETMNLKEGDYVRYQNRDGTIVRTARVMGLNDIYTNKGGGTTARVVVMPLLKTNRMGQTLEITICTKGKNVLHGLGNLCSGPVERVS